MYADDQTLLARGKSIDDLNNTINNDAVPIKSWISANSMRLNVKKTKSLLITTPYRLSRLNDRDVSLSVNIHGFSVPCVSSAKILGVTLDESLSWNDHINCMCTSLSKRIGLLRRVRSFIPIDYRIVLYYGLIQSTLDYCCVVWRNTPEKNLEKSREFMLLANYRKTFS